MKIKEKREEKLQHIPENTESHTHAQERSEKALSSPPADLKALQKEEVKGQTVLTCLTKC